MTPFVFIKMLLLEQKNIVVTAYFQKSRVKKEMIFPKNIVKTYFFNFIWTD